MSLDDENSKNNNASDLDIEKNQLLSQNQKVKSLVKQIMEKIERNKKYKKNSIEMLSELKNELINVLNKQKKDEKSDNIG